MQGEYQSPQSPAAIIEDSYSYTETVNLPVIKSRPVDRAPSDLFRYKVLKRFVDVVLVLVSAPVMLPLLGIVAVMVMLSSPGPVLYSHRRIRKNGAFFSMWKFRTMCLNSAELLDEYLARNPKAHKLRNDPRITPIGAFLRRYSLDELPQLWNVLTGQMSLVGPRPIVAAEVEKYGNYFDCYCRVKPGLTGLWQVSGRSELSYDARVALDCDYVNRWTLRRDGVILLKTFSTVLKQDGAF